MWLWSMPRRKEVPSPGTPGVQHLAEEQTHQQKQTPQHKGLTQQQSPGHGRTLMRGFPQFREWGLRSLRYVLGPSTPWRTRQYDARNRLGARARGGSEACQGSVTQHTLFFHGMCILSQKPPLAWCETRTSNPPCFLTEVRIRGVCLTLAWRA